MSREQADKLFAEAQYVDAIAIYEKQLPDIMFRIASGHQHFGTYREAIAAWTRLITAIEASDDRPRPGFASTISLAFMNRGICLAMRSDMAGALADVNRSVALETTPHNLYARASIFCEMKRYEMEAEDLTNAITLTKNLCFLKELRERQQDNLARNDQFSPLHPKPRIYCSDHQFETPTLSENSIIYVRDAKGKWVLSTVLKLKSDSELANWIMGLKLHALLPELWSVIAHYAAGSTVAYIHYEGWDSKWNEWINFRCDPDRVAAFPCPFLKPIDKPCLLHPRSPPDLRKENKYIMGKEVDFYPPCAIPRRWIRGTISQIDGDTGQVQVTYHQPSASQYWVPIESDEIHLRSAKSRAPTRNYVADARGLLASLFAVKS